MTLRVVLVVPSSAVFESMGPTLMRTAMLMPPVGVVGLASYLEVNGVEVAVVDAVTQRLDAGKCAQRISELQPDLVGFSALTWSFYYVTQTISALRCKLPDVPVVLGNIHAEVFYDSILRAGWADYIVMGEGERPLLALIRRLERGEQVRDIPGVVTRDSAGEPDNGERMLVDDLDSLPYPNWDLIDIQSYLQKILPIARDPIIGICATRGCRHRCNFCSQDKLIGRFRYRSAESVVKEMVQDNEKYGVNLFGFLDACFPWSEESGIEFCDLLIQQGLNRRFKWWCESRVDELSPGLLMRMAESGCGHILYGFESGDQQMLESMNKGITLEQSRNTAAATRKAGIPFHAFFVIGYPGETVRSVWRSIRFSHRLRPETVKFHMVIPMPGSRLYNQVRDQVSLDMEDPEQLQGFTNWNNWALSNGRPVYTPEGMSPRTLLTLFWLAHLAFYIRPWKLISLLFRGSVSPRFLWDIGVVFLGNLLGSKPKTESAGKAGTPTSSGRS